MGGRIRTVKPEILDDAKTASLSHEAFRLFIGLILLSDDYGNTHGSPRRLEGAVFHTTPSSRDPRELLDELRESGLVTLYEAHGQCYVHLNGWSKHQKVDHPGKPRVPQVQDESCTVIVNAFGGVQKPRETLAKVSEKPRETLAPDPDLGPRTSDPELSSVLTDSPGADAPGPTTTAVVEEPKVAEAPKVDEVGEVWSHYVATWRRVVNGKRAPTLNSKRRTHIKARLRELGLEDTKRAIDGLFASTFHVDGGWTAPEYVFRSTEQAEKMLVHAPCAAATAPLALFQTEKAPEVLSEPNPRLRASSEGDAAETNEPAKEPEAMPVLIKLAGGVK